MVDAGLNFWLTITALRCRGAIVMLCRAVWGPPRAGLPYPLTFNADGSVTVSEPITTFLGRSTQP